MDPKARIRLYKDADGSVAEVEHDAIDQDKSNDVQVSLTDCMATILTLADERPIQSFVMQQFEHIEDALFFLRRGRVGVYFGVAFDESDRPRDIEILKFLFVDGPVPSKPDREIAIARNALFQQAFHT